MTRDTSIEAFQSIKENGLLPKRRFEVYSILFKYGPLTAHEVVAIARKVYPNANQTSFNARLSELKEQQVVKEVGQKTNPLSGHANYLWDVTSKIPKPLTKPKQTKCSHCNGTGKEPQLEFGVK